MWEDKILKKIISKKNFDSSTWKFPKSFSNAYKKINKKDIINLNIPTGIPMVFKACENLTPIENYYLGDEKLINKKINHVKNISV